MKNQRMRVWFRRVGLAWVWVLGLGLGLVWVWVWVSACVWVLGGVRPGLGSGREINENNVRF